MELKNITKKYKTKNGDLTIFENAQFDSKNYKSIALCGRSGSGKTTLLSILAGLDIDYEGDYIYKDKVVYKSKGEMANIRFKNIAIVSQNFKLLKDRNIYENLAFSLRLLNIPEKEINIKIKSILKRMQLSYLINENPKKLSGGEKQRIVLARALLKEPEFILADEPTSELDEDTEKFILKIISDYCDKGIRFIIATHSEFLAKQCEVRYVIEDKKFVIK